MTEVMDAIIISSIIVIIIGILIDYVLFRIWHFYAHLDRYDIKSDMSSEGKKKKEKPWEKELKKRGYDLDDLEDL